MLGTSACIAKCVKETNYNPECQPTCLKEMTKRSTIDSLLEETVLEQNKVDEENRNRAQELAGKASVSKPFTDIDTGVNVQADATDQLWETLFVTLRSSLTIGGFSAGFELLPNSIELTNIELDIPNWRSMDLFEINRQPVEDYDNPRVLNQEIIQVARKAPFRITDGTYWNQEYMSYLSGVIGVSTINIPDPSTTLSAKKAEEYKWALQNCTESYHNADPLITNQMSYADYSLKFCTDVEQKKAAMYVELGAEMARNGGNKAYSAAVALGIAESYFTLSTAFKKYHSFRSMEYECLKAREGNRQPRGSPRSFELQYNYHTWNKTTESYLFTSGNRFPLFTTSTSRTIEGLDLTSIQTVQISFDNLKYVPVYPGDWYSPAAVVDFRYSPRAASAYPISRYFGNKGSLTLMPKGLFVAVNPTISLSVQSKAKQSFLQRITSGVSVFGIKLNRNVKVIDEGTTKNTIAKIRIESNNCRPQLLAIDNNYFY